MQSTSINNSGCVTVHRNSITGARLPCNSPRLPKRAVAITQAGLFGLKFGTASSADVKAQKQELLSAIQPLARGVNATDADEQQVEKLIQKLERVNPNKNTLASPLINGKWKLLYTTSQSILSKNRPAPLRANGPIYQYIDAVNGKARNQESWPFFNSVLADLTPETKTRVGVQFTLFRIFGLLPIKAPERAKGKLDTTFVDEELRISRGDKGNVFVLTMEDPSGKP
ncbi:hypothetical protein ABBQ32_001068 [Trebouxia sp. C0010 RCD-2024]